MALSGIFWLINFLFSRSNGKFSLMKKETERMRGHYLYRFEYLPAILIPMLIALIDSRIWDFGLLIAIAGWILLMISINMLNDYFDRDRILKLNYKSILMLSFLIAAMGFYFVSEHSLYFAIAYFVIMVAYDFKLKNIPIIENFLQVTAYCVLPYLAFVSEVSIFSLLILVFAGIFSELVHHMAHQEATYKFLGNRKTLYFSILISICLLVAGILYLIWGEHIYYWPVVLIATGGIYYSIKTLLGFRKIEDWIKVAMFGIETMKWSVVYLSIILIFKVG